MSLRKSPLLLKHTAKLHLVYLEGFFKYTTLTIIFKVKQDLRSKTVYLRYSLATLHVKQLITNRSSMHPHLVEIFYMDV